LTISFLVFGSTSLFVKQRCFLQIVFDFAKKKTAQTIFTYFWFLGFVFLKNPDNDVTGTM